MKAKKGPYTITSHLRTFHSTEREAKKVQVVPHRRLPSDQQSLKRAFNFHECLAHVTHAKAEPPKTERAFPLRTTLIRTGAVNFLGMTTRGGIPSLDLRGFLKESHRQTVSTKVQSRLTTAGEDEAPEYSQRYLTTAESYRPGPIFAASFRPLSNSQSKLPSLREKDRPTRRTQTSTSYSTFPKLLHAENTEAGPAAGFDEDQSQSLVNRLKQRVAQRRVQFRPEVIHLQTMNEEEVDSSPIRRIKRQSEEVNPEAIHLPERDPAARSLGTALNVFKLALRASSPKKGGPRISMSMTSFNFNPPNLEKPEPKREEDFSPTFRFPKALPLQFKKRFKQIRISLRNALQFLKSLKLTPRDVKQSPAVQLKK